MARAGQGRNSSLREEASHSSEQRASEAAQSGEGHQRGETSNPAHSYTEHELEASEPGKLHPLTPKRLPAPGKLEKGEALKQRVFEEGEQSMG